MTWGPTRELKLWRGNSGEYLGDLQVPDTLGSVCFSPNGKMVLYASTSGNSGILYAVSVDGRARHRLSDQSGDIREPVWGPFESK